MKHAQIAIIGAGTVGSTTAYALMLQNIATDIILVDIDEPRCKGEMLDHSDTLSFSGTSVIRSGTSKEAGQAKIIIIAAGARQKPEQSRIDLLQTNKKIVSSVIEKIEPINPETIIIMVTNPVDILTFHAQNLVQLPKTQVFGSGTFLDTQRLRGIIAEKINIAEQSIHAYILGEHGDTQFPAWSCARVAGIPLLDFPELTEKDLDAIAEKTRQQAYEIIACKGATYYGIAACVTAMCENILFDQKRVLPLSCYIEEFGICLSIPVVLGKNGIEQILSMPLNQQEQEKLAYSAEQLRTLTKL